MMRRSLSDLPARARPADGRTRTAGTEDALVVKRHGRWQQRHCSQRAAVFLRTSRARNRFAL